MMTPKLYLSALSPPQPFACAIYGKEPFRFLDVGCNISGMEDGTDVIHKCHLWWGFGGV